MAESDHLCTRGSDIQEKITTELMKTPVAQAEEQGTKGSEKNPSSQIDVLHVIEKYIYILKDLLCCQ